MTLAGVFQESSRRVRAQALPRPQQPPTHGGLPAANARRRGGVRLNHHATARLGAPPAAPRRGGAGRRQSQSAPSPVQKRRGGGERHMQQGEPAACALCRGASVSNYPTSDLTPAGHRAPPAAFLLQSQVPCMPLTPCHNDLPSQWHPLTTTSPHGATPKEGRGVPARPAPPTQSRSGVSPRSSSLRSTSGDSDHSNCRSACCSGHSRFSKAWWGRGRGRGRGACGRVSGRWVGEY